MERWFLSQFFRDERTGDDIPVCAAYGERYACPLHPDTPEGWALVKMETSTHQLEAAKADEEPRVLVCPLTVDPRPLVSVDSKLQLVIDTYAGWGATADMSLGVLLATLADKEPLFAQ